MCYLLSFLHLVYDAFTLHPTNLALKKRLLASSHVVLSCSSLLQPSTSQNQFYRNLCLPLHGRVSAEGLMFTLQGIAARQQHIWNIQEWLEGIRWGACRTTPTSIAPREIQPVPQRVLGMQMGVWWVGKVWLQNNTTNWTYNALVGTSCKKTVLQMEKPHMGVNWQVSTNFWCWMWGCSMLRLRTSSSPYSYPLSDNSLLHSQMLQIWCSPVWAFHSCNSRWPLTVHWNQ